MSITVGYHFDLWQFELRLKHAQEAPDQTDRDKTFLLDLKKRYRQYKGHCFLSEKQRARLQLLAFAGGWNMAMDKKEDCTCKA